MAAEPAQWFEGHKRQIFEQFFHFLKIPSVSTDPAYKKHVNACADWVLSFLKDSGLKAELWQTSGHPIAYGERILDEKYPTVLFYLHYDVQPPDPLDLWDSPPFEPEIREGEIYARGACDNKGQCFYTLNAIKAFIACHPEKKVNIKVCVEGEEEVGSVHLSKILPEKRDVLKADYLLIVDVGIPSLARPSVVVGARGIIALEVFCRTAAGDMHSGQMGGIAMNPIRVLCEGLSKLWDSKGKIAVPGIYDKIMQIPPQFKQQLDLVFDLEETKKSFGLKSLSTEEGKNPLEASWMRPSLDINGITGGYQGEGEKTVIPAQASAKLTCRLVPDQDPEEVGHLIAAYLRRHLEKNADVRIDVRHGAKATWTQFDSSIVKIARRSFEHVLKKPCGLALAGGTLPIAGELTAASGAELALIGYGLPTDQFHAPNEHFGVERFEKGFLTIAQILEGVANDESR